jgi:hypothetical protein
MLAHVSSLQLVSPPATLSITNTELKSFTSHIHLREIFSGKTWKVTCKETVFLLHKCVNWAENLHPSPFKFQILPWNKRA